MKELKLIIPILFISFFSSLNIAKSLDFSVTDTSVNDAIMVSHNTEEKVENVENKVTEKLASAKTDSSTTRRTKTTVASRSPKHFDFTGARYTNAGYGIGKVDTCTYKDKKGNCTLNTPNTGIAQYRYCQYCKPFLYGHNTSDFRTLQNMQSGDIFTVKVDGVAKKYLVVNNFTLPNSTANANAGDIYKSTYNGKYDITLQTCVGSSNATVRYIQAVAV